MTLAAWLLSLLIAQGENAGRPRPGRADLAKTLNVLMKQTGVPAHACVAVSRRTAALVTRMAGHNASRMLHPAQPASTVLQFPGQVQGRLGPLQRGSTALPSRHQLVHGRTRLITGQRRPRARLRALAHSPLPRQQPAGSVVCSRLPGPSWSSQACCSTPSVWEPRC
jgi:hypothetical protein